jgi:hypothetical protein
LHHVFGQAVVPSAQTWQGAETGGQSLSTLHCEVGGVGGHCGNETLQTPPGAQVACAQADEPSGHIWQTAGATQYGDGIGVGVDPEPDIPLGLPPVGAVAHWQMAHPLESVARPFGQFRAGQFVVGHGVGGFGSGTHWQVAQPLVSLTLLYPGAQLGQANAGQGAHWQVGHPFASFAM